MVNQIEISDQTKKILIGATAAGATVGVAYLAYRYLSDSGSDEAGNIQKQLEAIKLKGNEFFKQKNYGKAVEEFSRGIEAGAKGDDMNKLVAMMYQNRAACHEKLTTSSPFDVLNDCLAALKCDRKYAKAYLRAAKALSSVGKKMDALAYLMAAFAMDSNLNKSNFEFFEQLLTLDPADTVIQKPEELAKLDPEPLCLFRIQQWYDTWDVEDLFKVDIRNFKPNEEKNDEKAYRQALDLFKNEKYEEIPKVLTEDNQFVPAMILRAKFLTYSWNPDRATLYYPKVQKAVDDWLEAYNNEEELHKRELILSAMDVFKIEMLYTMENLNNFLIHDIEKEDVSKERKWKAYSFASIYVYNGCVLDAGETSHENQMISDTTNCSRLMELALQNGQATGHLTMIDSFVKLCSTQEYSALHQHIMAMERLVTNTPTHFTLVLTSKVYMMTGNPTAAEKLLEEAAKITTRYLVPSRILQEADLHVMKSEEERLASVTECAKKVIKIDPYNFSAHILLLLGSNGPDASIVEPKYIESMKQISNAAIFAPPRELLMMKKMVPLLNAKKRAAEMLGTYN